MMKICGCKKKKCPRADCIECPRCGCEHDGLSVAWKLSRTKGAPKRNITSTAADPAPTRRSLRERQDMDWFLSPPPLTPTPSFRKMPPYRDVMEFFGESLQRIEYVRNNIGSRNARFTPSFWDEAVTTPAEAKIRTVILNLYMSLLTCVAESICGSDAAQASLQLFTLWLSSPKSESSALVPSTSKSRLTYLSTIGPTMEATTKGSVERRVVRSILCQSLPWSELRFAAVTIRGISVSRESYAKGRRDYDLLQCSGSLAKPDWTREKFATESADIAIKIILSLDNVAFVSWGTKRLKLDGVAHDVPSILLRKPANVIFDQYSKAATESVRLSRATFYRLVAVLTNGSVQARTSVDYVTGFLLNDNCGLLKRILVDLVPEDTDQLCRKLDTMKVWMKYGTTSVFEGSSVAPSASCPRHLINFGLSQATPEEMDERQISCSPCEGFQRLLIAIRQRVAEAGANANTLSVISDCYGKLELFLGHRLRVLNQQRALHELFQNMKASCVANQDAEEALVVIDFKMKVEPVYFREKTVDHYGKRGMSWHGAMVRFWSKESASASPEDNKVYFDHISHTDNRQDKDAVHSLIEAMLISLKRDLPHISTITVQSDNASSYQNAYVTLMLPVIGAAHGIRIARYVHTDTQDGKSLLDAHFARAMKKVHVWVQQGHNCSTPSQLVSGLSADGGIVNSMAELVEYNRERSILLWKQAQPIVLALTAICPRVNDAFYDFPTPNGGPNSAARDSEFHFRLIPQFGIRLFSYSGVGDGACVVVKPEEKSCTLMKETVSFETTCLPGSSALESAIPSVALAQSENNVHTSSGATNINDACGPVNGDLNTDGLERDILFTGEDNSSCFCGHSRLQNVNDTEETLLEDSADYDSRPSELQNTECSVEEEVLDGLDVDSDDRDESDMEECENERRTTCEIVLPVDNIGKVTGVHLSTSAQIRRRARKWRQSPQALPLSVSVTSIPAERDITDYAKRCLLAMKNAGTLSVIESDGLSTEMARLGAIIDTNMSDQPTILKKGWARRPAWGQMYGARYMKRYDSEIAAMFEEGETNASNKLGPARMLEVLMSRHPGCYDLPSENDIRAEISKLARSGRKRRVDTTINSAAVPGVGSASVPPKTKIKMESCHADFLSTLVADNPAIKPKDALGRFRAEFPTSDAKLTDKKVTDKVSSIKHRAKKHIMYTTPTKKRPRTT